MDHSNISPSQAERFFNCPGSVSLQSKIKLNLPPNQAGIEGTAIHEFAADCLVKNLDPNKRTRERVAVRVNGNHASMPVTDDFVFVTKMYLRYIDNVLKGHNLTRDCLQVEAKFDLPEIDPDAHGTTDCSFLAGDTLYVIDLKTGRGILVDPVENKQCMYYALRPFFDARMFIQKVVIVIIQPRAKDGDYIKEWVTTPERLDAFAGELKAAIAETRVKKPTVEAGKWCTFCKAAGSCAGIQKTIVSTGQAVIPQLDRAFPVVKELTPEQIGKALPIMELLKTFMSTLEGYAYTLAMSGVEIPNYCLIRSRKNRRWKEEDAVIDELYDEFGEDIFSRKLLSPAQIEKLAGKERVADHIFVPEGELTLALKKDVKDQIKRTAEEAFKDVVIN